MVFDALSDLARRRTTKRYHDGVRRFLPACLAIACGARTELGTTPDASIDVASHDAVLELTEVGPPPPACTATQTTSLGPTNGIVNGLALDDAYVYFRESDGLSRLPKGGGIPQHVGATQLTGGSFINAFVVDAKYAYLGDANGAVVRVAKQGGPEESLGLNVPQALFTLDGENLYAWGWEGSTNLYRLVLGGGMTVVTSSLPALTNSIVIDGNTAYIGAAQTGLFKLNLLDGLVVFMAQVEAWNLVADATNLYFSTGDHGPNGPNAIMSTAKADGTTTTLTSAKYAFGLALDGGQIYYTDEFEGTVRRISTQGGVSAIIDSTPDDYPTAIATDDRCVYWSSVGGIWVAPR